MTLRFGRRAWVVAALVAAAVAAGSAAVHERGTTVEYFTAPVSRGDIRNVVSATGTVQAVVTVNVGSQVSGQIQAVYADFNSTVKRGQLLAKIDPRPFQAQLENAESNLLAAEAHVRTSTANVANQQANAESAQANADAALAAQRSAAVTLQRDRTLLARELLDRSDYDDAVAAADEAAAKYKAAQAAATQAATAIAGAQADLAQAQAQVAEARATVRSSQLNLGFTNIVSPVDGVVISRSVDVGQTVAASLQAPLMFVIANNLREMQVNANVDEADVGQLSPNSRVAFSVDAYPNETFAGRIAEIRLAPQTIQNVVTYSVIIDVDNSKLELRPGMTANVNILVAERRDVLKIPNGALRYSPEKAAELAVDMPLARPVPDADARPSPVGSSGSAGVSRAPSDVRAAPQAPGQDWDPAAKVVFPAPPPPRPRDAVVWVLENGRPVPKRVLVGITDGVSTAVVSQGLHAGDRLVIADTSQAAASQPQAGGMAPFRFGR